MRTTPAGPSSPPRKVDRGLMLVVQSSSALSLATLAALLSSIRTISPRLEVTFSFVTIIAFVLAGLASVVFWHLIFKLNDRSEQPGSPRNRLRIGSAILGSVLAAGVVFAFLHPLKDFSREKQSEISLGASIAVIFLSVLAFLLWRVVRFLEKDSASNP